MAKVERADVYPFKHDVYLSVVFRLLETDEIYKWKEYYRIAISNFDLGHQLHRYLGQYPEVEVIVDANNHEQHYVLLEPVMLDPIRQNQRVYKMINVVLEVILIFMTVILLGKYFL